MKTKICTKCGKEKSTKEFYWNKYFSDYASWCKECQKEQAKKYRQTKKGKATVNRYNRSYKGKITRKKASLKCKYNITPEDWDRIFNEQNGCCAICGRHQSKLERDLAVHHDCKTEKVVCLLCSDCNIGLGMFHHNPELMEKAAALVRQHQKNSKTD